MNFQECLKKILKNSKYFIKGQLNKTALSTDASTDNEDLIALLLSEQRIKDHFFKKIRDVLIFQKDKFTDFINCKEFLPNSYTSFSNRIGLNLKGKPLSNVKDVVLDFPYKDCILQGGQDKEDQKRDEVFYNETLAPDEIDRLLEPKAFTNFKKYDQKGKHDLDDDHKISKDNLIIKGNNLLVLHSLLGQYRGKVKLIYIDPPYNTGGDANIFTYNNNFNHSTWLTFIKNRLKVARSLLRDNGFIAIAIDRFELGYLIVLADEIFGKNNRLGVITIINNPMGRNQAKYFSTINDFMIVYSKKQELVSFNNVILNSEFYKTFDKEDYQGKYKLKNFIRIGGGDINLRINKENFWYPIYVSHDLKQLKLEKIKGYFEIFPVTSNGQERTWKLSRKSAENYLNELVAVKDKETIIINEKYRIDKGQKVSTVWSDKKYNANHNGIRLLENIMGEKVFSYPKSLYTVLDTLKIMTDKNDIILDFFAGSGTTGHATLELNKEDDGNRSFILIEQLNEHIEVCKERIQKVIEKHSKENNIFKDENKEAPSFTYLELAKFNQSIIDKIRSSKDKKELLPILEQIKKEKQCYLDFEVEIEKFNDKEFSDLSLDEQKKIFIACLDKNHLYVNLSDMEDSKYKLSKKDIELNKIFYKEEYGL